MKIKINVVNDNEETSIKDEEYLGQQVHTTGQPVHPGDVLLIKVKDKLFECEIKFRKFLNLFKVHLYPLDKDDKELLANDRINPNILKRNYMDGTIVFDLYVKKNDDDYPYHEVDYTKGKFHLISPSTALNAYEEEFSEQPFTVVKFLTKSVPSSAVQDNDLTEYKPSIKPLPEYARDVFNPSQAIGEPVEDGDTFLIEVADKSFKCEIHETDDLFKNHQNVFSARIYPLDKDDVTIAYEDYFEVVLIFDRHVENHDHYVIDFTKGKISPVDYFPLIHEDTPFTVTKFLAHSGKTSTVQDNDLTEYRNSIKPEPKKDKIRRTRTAIGQPPHVGDVLLIKVKDKLYECEIEDEEVFDRNPSLFSARIYPLDKDDKKLLENDGDRIISHSAKRKYERVTIKFSYDLNGFKNNKINWEYDFTKGMIKPHWNEIFDGEQPFTVVKFLTRSVPASTVQDAGINFDNLENDISEDLNNNFSNLYYDCIDFRYLLEDYEKAIEEIIYNDEPSDEYDEDPKDREYKDYLEKVASCIPDIIYSLKDLEKEIQKRR